VISALRRGNAGTRSDVSGSWYNENGCPNPVRCQEPACTFYLAAMTSTQACSRRCVPVLHAGCRVDPRPRVYRDMSEADCAVYEPVLPPRLAGQPGGQSGG